MAGMIRAGCCNHNHEGQEMIIAGSGGDKRQETCSNKPRHLSPVRCRAQEQALTHEKQFVCLWVLARNQELSPPLCRGCGEVDLEFEGCNNGLVISTRNDHQETDFYCFLPELKHENVQGTEAGMTLDIDREISGGKWNWSLLNCERSEVRCGLRDLMLFAQAPGMRELAAFFSILAKSYPLGHLSCCSHFSSQWKPINNDKFCESPSEPTPSILLSAQLTAISLWAGTPSSCLRSPELQSPVSPIEVKLSSVCVFV